MTLLNVLMTADWQVCCGSILGQGQSKDGADMGAAGGWGVQQPHGCRQHPQLVQLDLVHEPSRLRELTLPVLLSCCHVLTCRLVVERTMHVLLLPALPML